MSDSLIKNIWKAMMPVLCEGSRSFELKKNLHYKGLVLLAILSFKRAVCLKGDPEFSKKFSDQIEEMTIIETIKRKLQAVMPYASEDIDRFFQFGEHSFEEIDLTCFLEYLDGLDLSPKVSDQTMEQVIGCLMSRIFALHVRSDKRLWDISNQSEDINQLVVDLLISFRDDMAPYDDVLSLYTPVIGTGALMAKLYMALKEVSQNSLFTYCCGYGSSLHEVLLSNLYFTVLGMTPFEVLWDNCLFETGQQTQDPQHKYKSYNLIFCEPPQKFEISAVKDLIFKDFEKKSYANFFDHKKPILEGCTHKDLYLAHTLSKMDTNGGRAVFISDTLHISESLLVPIIQKDLLDTIIELPPNSLSTFPGKGYIFIFSNQKRIPKKGFLHYINAGHPRIKNLYWEPLNKISGCKKNFLTEDGLSQILDLYHDFRESEYSQIIDMQDLSYKRIQIRFPLRLKVNLCESLKREEFKKELRLLLSNSEIKFFWPALVSFCENNEALLERNKIDFDETLKQLSIAVRKHDGKPILSRVKLFKVLSFASVKFRKAKPVSMLTGKGWMEDVETYQFHSSSIILGLSQNVNEAVRGWSSSLDPDAWLDDHVEIKYGGNFYRLIASLEEDPSETHIFHFEEMNESLMFDENE